MQLNMCKTCGGELERRGNHFYCLYCGNKWMIDAESDIQTIDRANAWSALRDCDFEKAAELFENIIFKEPQNFEAYWGRALAKASIIYVTDLDERKRVPTCNNISEISFLEMSDVKKAIELAPTEIADGYKEQAEKIEAIRVEWLEKARKEPEYDVFICFKDSDKEKGLKRTPDSYSAHNLYNVLTAAGYKVFFSRESLKDKTSEHYEPYIYNALETAKIMIVYGESPEYFSAVWVKNEWTRFRDRIRDGKKHKSSLVVVYKDMTPDQLPVGLSNIQGLDASEITFLETLKTHIERIISTYKKEAHIEHIEIKGGEVSKKASKIANETIETREIGSGMSAETDITEIQHLDLAKSYISVGSWDKAKVIVNSILLNTPNNGYALWLSLLIRYEVNDKASFLRKAEKFGFDKSELALLGKLLDASTKEFAGELLDDLYDLVGVLAEDEIVPIVELILRYNYPNRDKKLKACYTVAIKKSYFKLFQLLIRYLDSKDVDIYIDYHFKYARSTTSDNEKRKCVESILAVEEGNVIALKMKFDLDWYKPNVTVDELVNDLETILKYCGNTNEAVLWALDYYRRISNYDHSLFMEQAIRYYSGELSELSEFLVSASGAIMKWGYSDIASRFIELAVAAGCTDPQVYWTVCLIKVGAKSERDIVNSDISLESVAEYTKYLTLVDEARRRECFALANAQEKAIKDRIARNESAARNAEERRRQAEQERQRYIKSQQKITTKLNIVSGIFVAVMCILTFVGYSNDWHVWIKETFFPLFSFHYFYNHMVWKFIVSGIFGVIVGITIFIKAGRAACDGAGGCEDGGCCCGLLGGYLAGGFSGIVTFGVILAIFCSLGYVGVALFSQYGSFAIALGGIIPVLVISRKYAEKKNKHRFWIYFLIILAVAAICFYFANNFIGDYSMFNFEPIEQ